MISATQDPSLTLTLDNEAAFPQGQLYYEDASLSTDGLYRKRLVSLRSQILRLVVLITNFSQCVVNVSDEMTLRVDPPGILHRGMTIIVTCVIRYGGPAAISSTQDPSLTLTLDNEAAFPQGQVYYEDASSSTDGLYRKRLVSLRSLILKLVVLY